VKGVVQATSKFRRIKTYQVKNRNDEERLVLVEQPVDNNFKLVGEKPRETASDFYRFELKVPAGQKKDLVVTEERDEFHRWEISTTSDDQIKFLISQPLATPSMKKAMQNAMDLRWALAKTTREIGELQRQLSTLVNDQQRLRENIKATPSTAAVYKKYLKKLDDQEEQIEKHQEDIKKLQKQEHDQKKAFDDFLANFNDGATDADKKDEDRRREEDSKKISAESEVKPRPGKKDADREATVKGTPLTAEEARWLKEMVDAEKDPAKRQEINDEFREESSLGRAAIYKLFRKDSGR
jgi:hypothetical protein